VEEPQRAFTILAQFLRVLAVLPEGGVDERKEKEEGNRFRYEEDGDEERGFNI
jgi:hypothetical protein